MTRQIACLSPSRRRRRRPGRGGSNQQPTTRPSRMWYRPTVDQRRWTPATTAVPSVRAAMRSPSPTSTSPGCIRKVRSTRSRAAGSTPIRCRSPGSHPQSRYGRGRANGHRRPAAPGPARRHRRRRKPAGPLEPSQQLDGFGSTMTWLMKAPNVPSWTYSSRRPSPRAHEVA
jgi:hypothetical protein